MGTASTSRIGLAFPPEAQGEPSAEAVSAVDSYVDSMRGPEPLLPLAASIRQQHEFGNPALLARIVAHSEIDERGTRRQHLRFGAAAVPEDDLHGALASRQRRAEAERRQRQAGPSFVQGPAHDASAELAALPAAASGPPAPPSMGWDAAAAPASVAVSSQMEAARAAARAVAAQLSQRVAPSRNDR